MCTEKEETAKRSIFYDFAYILSSLSLLPILCILYLFSSCTHQITTTTLLPSSSSNKYNKKTHLFHFLLFSTNTQLHFLLFSKKKIPRFSVNTSNFLLFDETEPKGKRICNKISCLFHFMSSKKQVWKK